MLLDTARLAGKVRSKAVVRKVCADVCELILVKERDFEFVS